MRKEGKKQEHRNVVTHQLRRRGSAEVNVEPERLTVQAEKQFEAVLRRENDWGRSTGEKNREKKGKQRRILSKSSHFPSPTTPVDHYTEVWLQARSAPPSYEDPVTASFLRCSLSSTRASAAFKMECEEGKETNMKT
jgi:hypothetical protein